MNNDVKKILYCFRLGGPKAVAIAVRSRLEHKDLIGDYIAECVSKASVDEYPELLTTLFGIWTGEHLNLDNPRSFNEKMQWLKLYDSTPLKTQLVDKYLVKDWVRSKIGGGAVVPLYGVWDSFDDIDFDALPNEFVLKTNHGCGGYILIDNKDSLNKEAARKQFTKSLSVNYAWRGMELQYAHVKPCIIAEQLLHTKDDLRDYKFFCFNGEPRYVFVVADRQSKEAKTKCGFYDTNWEIKKFNLGCFAQLEESSSRPKNLELMMRYARILSESFAFVRVDFYELDDGSVYFGEMTFTPGGGIYNWSPRESNVMLGDLIDLSHTQKTLFKK